MIIPLWRRIGAVLAIVVLLSVALVPVAAAGGNAAPAASGGCFYYVVRPGDNLTRIAARYGTTVWAIQQQNGIWNPDRIYVGQRLLICRGTPPPPPPPPPPPCPPGWCTVCVPPACCPSCPGPIPIPPQPPPGPWSAQYFNNRDLSGAPTVMRTEASVNYNWGFGSPAPGVGPTNWSGRWQRTFNLAPGTWRVTVRSDDGVRVSISDVLVINSWQVQAATTFIQDVIVGGGNHLVTIEYFQAEGVSELQFSLTKVR